MAGMPSEIKVNVSTGEIVDHGAVTKEWLLAHITDLIEKKIAIEKRITFRVCVEDGSGRFVVTWGDK